jgi:DNA helicase HerA-like ATPase
LSRAIQNPGGTKLSAGLDRRSRPGTPPIDLPSELASTILSQCNTVFAFRLSNERDQEIIQATIAEASSAMFSVLPFLGNSEAIAIGEGVPVPMRLRFDVLPPEEQPLSNSARFSERWRSPEGGDAEEMQRVVAALRGVRPD